MSGKELRWWSLLALGLGLVLVTGCELNLEEAVSAGLFDFVAGTITDSLTALLPVATVVAGNAGA